MAPPSKSDPPSPPPPPLLFFKPLPEGNQHNVIFSLTTIPNRRFLTISTVSIILLSLTTYIFYPSEPDLKIVRFRLHHFQIYTTPVLAVNISLFLTIKVQNLDVYSMDYTALGVVVGYRGRNLAHVRSDRGHLPARGSSYVNAELTFNGVEVLFDVMYLLEDLAKGTIPFDTVTEINGRFGLLWFEFPLQAKLSCDITINTINPTVTYQNCYTQ